MVTRLAATLVVLCLTLAWAVPAAARAHPEGRAGVPAMVAIFHRPGAHPYVVHIYGRETRTLSGVVEVGGDAHDKWEPPACAVTVTGVCIEP